VPTPPPALRSLLLLLAPMLCAGCVLPQKSAGPDPNAVERVLARAAAQLRPCYRSPPVASEARQISTRLRLHFAPDGSLAALPQLVSQENVTPENRAYAARMAQAATAAVIGCAPVRLPAELYRGGWDEFDLLFRLGRPV
jgi:hypothetical protein